MQSTQNINKIQVNWIVFLYKNNLIHNICEHLVSHQNNSSGDNLIFSLFLPTFITSK